MSLSPGRFDKFFQALYQREPFPWQSRLARDLANGNWPDCVDLPTASGKTSLIDIAIYTLAMQAARPSGERTIGRRIFFTVNRRVIVDEAYERAVALAKRLKNDPTGIIKEVADALIALGGDNNLPLDVAQLRGGVFRDSAWTRSIVQPTVICTTADQLGSRLLFRGYGVSPGMQPIHAALCACDSLVLLDEAHVTKAFAQTLRLLQKYQQHSPCLRFVEMTATPSDAPKLRFSLGDDDRQHPMLRARQEASKPATLAKVNQKAIVAEFVKRANEAVTEQRKAIGIIVNRVQTARDVYAQLREQHPHAAYLLIGRMRPLDRDDLQRQLRAFVGPDRPDILDKPIFIVATQCLEVGADYDFDALITECASIDALRQRFGRLNRKGRDLPVVASILTSDAALKDDDPVYGSALKQTWDWLTESGRNSVDFGIAAFGKLWDQLNDEVRVRMTNETQDAAVLLPAHLDALCQTNPEPVPSPDVSYFIHGPGRDNAEVQVCWRDDLGADEALWPEIVRLLPPTSPECMTVPLRTLRHWMLSDNSPVDADAPIHDDGPIREKPTHKRIVLRWRGAKDATPICDPNDLRAGDTVVIPASETSSRILGHLPEDAAGNIAYDVAEQAFAQARRQQVIRLHPAIHPELLQPFEAYLREHDALSKAKIRDLLRSHDVLKADFSSGPAEIEYPDKEPKAVVLRFNALLPPSDDWKEEELIEDDGDDSASDSTARLLLSTHTSDVIRCTKANVDLLDVTQLASLFALAATHHDAGKADLRFTAMLAGTAPYEVLGRPPLAKSGDRSLSHFERQQKRKRAMVPEGFRHEAVSMQCVTYRLDRLVVDPLVDRDLLLHLIVSHHGHARPFVPVCDDCPADPELLSIDFDGQTVTPAQRQSWTPLHRLDSGVAERFWKLTRKHGWWGLAYLESILRLADQQASREEQLKGDEKEKTNE
jgi:CRISPR-associated endonuclease/helicase Cas3